MKIALALTILLGIYQTTQGVIRGQHAFGDEVISMVALHETVNGNFICGGTIINNNWILTAASCAQKPIGMEAIAGLQFALHVTISSDRWQRRVIDYAVVHDKYRTGQPQNDIALLHISEPFEWTEHVQAAELPAPGEIPSGEVKFFGLGQSTIGYPKTSDASGVQRLTVNILDWNECRQLLPPNITLDHRMVCTEQIPRQSFCPHDEGGPLVIQRGKKPVLLVGIASWAYTPCGFVPYPNVYTQVSSYLGWIAESMKTM